MPELPEVETVVQTLGRRVTGRVILCVHCHRTDIIHPAGANLPALLTGRRIQRIHRRGKRIVITLDDGSWFWIHLGMTGRLTAECADAPLRPHTHICLELANIVDSDKSALSEPVSEAISQIRFCDPRRFGGMFIPAPDESPDGNMGPEPLTMAPDQLADCLRGTARPIKSALLDQSVVAGIGNIYADEALFAARIHPLTPANRIKRDEVGLLCESIQSILQNAIDAGGSTLRDFLDADGHAGRFQDRHKVYGHESAPCPTCGKGIVRIVLSGRSTHFCTACQPRRNSRQTSAAHKSAPVPRSRKQTPAPLP